MEFAAAFAGAEDVGVVVHDLGLVDAHLLQYFLPLNHVYFAVVSSR